MAATIGSAARRVNPAAVGPASGLRRQRGELVELVDIGYQDAGARLDEIEDLPALGAHLRHPAGPGVDGGLLRHELIGERRGWQGLAAILHQPVDPSRPSGYYARRRPDSSRLVGP
jgi:hypothetical protein